ncbi:MAG TPA: DUF72 domain-containing protein, partial [Acidimicrobiales bacterium]|nr:DUF72 domain-containing protein [Acidimicrobiales bacterium]
MPVWVGTSGWQYKDWRGPVYPPGVPTKRWLPFYAGRFPTVEVNNAFYRLPERSTFRSWEEAVPSGFLFAVKASRYLTHVKRLREPREPVRRLWDRADALGAKLGPVLVQLPPNLQADVDALDATLAAFPGGARVTVEFRHPSWEADGVRRVLERRGAACCLADRNGPVGPWWRTTEWGYVRFHQGRAQPPGRYGRHALATAISRLRDLMGTADDLYIYFNNDHQ